MRRFTREQKFQILAVVTGSTIICYLLMHMFYTLVEQHDFLGHIDVEKVNPLVPKVGIRENEPDHWRSSNGTASQEVIENAEDTDSGPNAQPKLVKYPGQLGRPYAADMPTVESDAVFSIRELRRFNALFNTWPKSKPRAFIYFLVQGDNKHWSKFMKSLKLLHQHFNNVYSYPVVVFYESLSKRQISEMQAVTLSNVFAQWVQFELPTFLEKEIPERTSCSKHGIGYRHMCRFHAGMVYKQPIFNGIEYYWRLDDDSQILAPIDHDVFLYMKTHDLWYGFILITHEPKACVQDLWDITDAYIKTYSIKPTTFLKWREGNMFYNNFEISRVDIWTSDGYVQYFNEIDKAGGIYYYRWGDAVIKGLGVSLFVPSKKIHCFTNIKYRHNFWTDDLRSFPSCYINVHKNKKNTP